MASQKIYIFLVCLGFSFLTKAQILIERKHKPTELVAKVLLGKNSGLYIDSVSFLGNIQGIGSFATNTKYLPINKGILLSTGLAENADGPNESTNTGTKLFAQGDIQLENLANNKTYDATALEIWFYAATTEISFDYFFASEEYPEYVNKGVNDVFGFFISQSGDSETYNMAILPNSLDVVSVDNINSKKNPEWYVENRIWDLEDLDFYSKNIMAGELAFNCEYDGMTKVLKAKSTIIPYAKYHLKIAIADVGDDVYDSGVFIKSES